MSGGGTGMGKLFLCFLVFVGKNATNEILFGTANTKVRRSSVRCACVHANQMVFVIMPHTDCVFSHPSPPQQQQQPPAHTKNMETRTCGEGKLEERKKFPNSSCFEF